MQGIRSLIARRRPTGAAHGNNDGSGAGDGLGPAAAPAADPVEDRDLILARSARDHVPAPVPPKGPPRAVMQGDAGAMRETQPQTPDAPVPASLPASPPPAALPRSRIWDLEPAAPASSTATDRPPLPVSHCDFPADPAPPRPGAAPDRARTRLLGFHGAEPLADPFATTPEAPARPGGAAQRFPIGWLVVIDGPGRGASFTLTEGLSTLGRDPGQTVALDFGDASISRHNHVSIAYDAEDNCAWVGHGGKQNIVRLNDRPLVATEALADGDMLRIGRTVLRFVAFCDESFAWGTEPGSDG